MIDTLTKRVMRPLLSPMVEELKNQGGAFRSDEWYLQISHHLDRFDRPRSKIFGQGPAGIIVKGYDDTIELVQCSLPRVLFGNNGSLIRSPQDQADGLFALESILDKISTPAKPLIEFVRVDLVLHFRCDVQKFIAAHRHCRHPLIRNETVEYDGSGIKLRGQNASLLFYDKYLQMGAAPGDILRLEIQLRKPKLGELFGKAEGEPLTRIDFWMAYRICRRVVCLLTPKPLPKKLDFNRLLAECEAAGFRLSNGLTAMETYRACVDRETLMGRRRQIKGLILAVVGSIGNNSFPQTAFPRTSRMQSRNPFKIYEKQPKAKQCSQIQR